MRSANMETKTAQDPTPVEQAIVIAKQTFVPGHAQLKEIETDPRQARLCKKDIRFHRHANWITDTNFIAAKGPADEHEMSDFITDTAYNGFRPIHQIIALGHCLAYTDYTYHDFYDYILKEREADFGKYHVTIKRVSGKSTTTVSAHQIFPHGAIQSQINIRPTGGGTTKQLNVTLINLRDNHALDLRAPKKAVLKEVLWQLFMKSLKEPIMIHCAAGLGRTGHLILTFEILKYYSAIFESNDPKNIAAKIHDILNDMRACRPGLVLTEHQFECAIRNAGILRAYALEKEYISVNKQDETKISPVSLFANKSINASQTATDNKVSPKPA